MGRDASANRPNWQSAGRLADSGEKKKPTGVGFEKRLSE
jgi:hypothetical protein